MLHFPFVYFTEIKLRVQTPCMSSSVPLHSEYSSLHRRSQGIEKQICSLISISPLDKRLIFLNFVVIPLSSAPSLCRLRLCRTNHKLYNPRTHRYCFHNSCSEQSNISLKSITGNHVTSKAPLARADTRLPSSSSSKNLQLFQQRFHLIR